MRRRIVRARPGDGREQAGGAGGFTLLEVVIAMGVLAFGLLGLAAMQLYSLSQGREGRHTARAALVAQDQLEEFQRTDFDSTDLDPTGGWQAVGNVTEDVQSGTNRTEMTYQVEKRIVDAGGGWTKNVDVRVTWDEPERPNRQLVMSTVRYDY